MVENQITLFVGDVDESLGVAAKNHDASAFLIDVSNYEQFLTTKFDSNITAYTSLGDLPKNLEIFYTVATKATKIVYCPPTKWSDNLELDVTDPNVSIKGLTEHLLLCICDVVPVENIELCYLTPTVNPLLDNRVSEGPQMWFVGCCMTEGVGVYPSERYGQLVTEKLNLPASFLAKAASPMYSTADQILRSDIREGDTVVWGITCTELTIYVEDGSMRRVTPLSYLTYPDIERRLPIRLMYDETNFYTQLYAIEQIINYCQQRKINLLLIGLLISPNMLRFLKTKDNFFNYPYELDFSDDSYAKKFLDYGTDDMHPGPEQHKLFADFVLKHLEALYPTLFDRG